MATNYRICKYCGEENLMWARFCRSCQGSLEGAEVLAVARPLRVPRSLWAGVLLCAMAFAIFWTLFPTTSGGLQSGGAKTLKVIWHKFYGNYGQEWVVGDVRNESHSTLRQLMVAGEFYDEGGRQVESAMAPIDRSVLGPGQVSHFKLAAPYKEEISQNWFHFQTRDGHQISFDR